MKIASLDPGTKSGLVLWEGAVDRSYMGAEVVEGLAGSFEVRGDGWIDSVGCILDVINDYQAELLLYENFVLHGGGGHSSDPEALDSIRVTSGLLCMLGKGFPVVGFSTSIKAVMTDKRMKLWGMMRSGRGAVMDLPDGGISGGEGHATDAARGLVWYLRGGANAGV